MRYVVTWQFMDTATGPQWVAIGSYVPHPFGEITSVGYAPQTLAMRSAMLNFMP